MSLAALRRKDNPFRALRRPLVPENVARWRFPGLEDRVTIVGATGSGKTTAGAWLLSFADFDKQPFVIVNFKRERIFRAISRAIQIDVEEDIPTKPGLYHLEPVVGLDDDALESWLWKVWRNASNGRPVGIFVDEGYLWPNVKHSKALRAVLVTGRSLKIPTTILSQRPVEIPRFAFSETTFFQQFRLNDARDYATVEEFTPDDEVWSRETELPRFHSRWRDQAENFSCHLAPVPDMNRILERFDARLRPRKRLI